MKSFLKQYGAPLAVVLALPVLAGFSLLGPNPVAAWQTAQLNYPGGNNMGLTNIGYPKYVRSFYRWNFTNINYAFDQSFIEYFGTNGMQAVREAMAILNNLPPASKIDLNNYPLDSKLLNYQAQLAGLLDLKSYTLALLLEQLGLAEPERYAWTLDNRVAVGNVTNYHVISLNFDPVTLAPSPMVNDIYYTYQIVEAGAVADAVEQPVTFNDRVPYSSVAGGRLGPGFLYTGLTRDDVGGLRYLYHTNTLAIEDLQAIPNFGTSKPPSLLSVQGWVPWQGTTNVITNIYNFSNYWTPIIQAGLTNQSNFFTVGVRGGVNKIKFTEVAYESVVGQTMIPITNYFDDLVIVSNRVYTQQFSRDGLLQPDILFAVDHLRFNPDGLSPILLQRTTPMPAQNNDNLNGQPAFVNEGGPGTFTGPVIITFNADMGGLYNSTPYFLNEQWSQLGVRWGSYDHTPTTPIIYPVGPGELTFNELLALIEQSLNQNR
jgi:hypothetical protein